MRAIGLLLVSPVLVVAAYTFLRDDELEPYRGLPLLIRSAACAAAYAVLWARAGLRSGRYPAGHGDLLVDPDRNPAARAG